MICEKCGKEHDGTYGTGRFCSKGCAHARILSEETKHKISASLIKKGGKIKKCNFCGNPINIGDHTLCKKHQSIKWYKNLIPFGFDYSKIGTDAFFNEYEKAINLLVSEYLNNHLSPKDIYDKYNCSKYINHSETILWILKKIGINTRGWSESTKNAIFQGKKVIPSPYGFCSCWHITWNNKEVFLRSSYELDYAKELDIQQIEYEVEFLKIKYFDSQKKEYRCAIPDFYFPDTNTIVEVKSNWTLDIQNMKDKFKAYKEQGYNCKLLYEHKFVDLYLL